MDYWKDIALLAAGAAIGYATGLHFARQSGRDLKREAGELRRVLEVLVRGMEQQGWIEVTRNAEGMTKGFVFRITPGTGEAKFEGYPPTVTVGAKGKVCVAGNIEIHTGQKDDPAARP